MKTLNPVYWHQGLFLQPQHFQIAERYQNEKIASALSHGFPHFWGVARMKLLESAFSNRTCEVESGEFLFPDGTFVSYPNDAVLKARSFDVEYLEGDRSLLIYLGLKKFSPRGDNVTVVADVNEISAISSRFVTSTESESIEDLYSGVGSAPVRTMRHVLKIVWEHELESHGDYLLIPIARVLRKDSDIVSDPYFLPAVVSIGAAANLTTMIKEIRDDLAARTMQLASYEGQQRSESKSSFDATLMRYKLAYRTLSRYVPRLFHLTEGGDVHPWPIYGLLREVIGEVSTFTQTVNVLGETKAGEALLPPYNHSDIGGCFIAARSLLGKMLNEITIGPEFLVDLHLIDGLFVADVPPKFFDQNVDFFLIVTTLTAVSDYGASLLTTAKLSAKDRLPVLRDRSLPGVPIGHVQSPPAEMPRRRDSQIFKVDSTADEWLAVEREKRVALSWIEAPDDVQLELVIVRR